MFQRFGLDTMQIPPLFYHITSGSLELVHVGLIGICQIEKWEMLHHSNDLFVVRRFHFFELVVIPHVVILIEVMRAQSQAHRPRRKVLQRAPDTRYDQQALIRTVQRVGILLNAIIDGHIKTATNGNNELLTCVMAMSASLATTRHIIYIKCAFDIERKVNAVIHCREVSISMMIAIQRDNLAFPDARLVVNPGSFFITIHLVYFSMT